MKFLTRRVAIAGCHSHVIARPGVVLFFSLRLDLVQHTSLVVGTATEEQRIQEADRASSGGKQGIRV